MAVGDPSRARHRRDFVTLAGLVSARDLREAALTAKDRQRLRAVAAAIRDDRSMLLDRPDAEGLLRRLERGADMS